ncbi:hypothetical protein K432DRAFT_294883 [Lepidopterella palustris CBS 459.81]|uniref:Uncharacterized protein n=1 Tax=Lepidopterella palustris CBS 459.81 TaxID=1314670 RepID=A0A8E2EDG5_9PEZI|nr:hypothetical protein K432DRAFT_294883 [Lepidopterella palustris CBS 459.81]
MECSGTNEHQISGPAESTDSADSPKFICPDCNRAYKAVETLNRHRKNHSKSIDYVCNTCGSGFRRKDLLDRHMQIHDEGQASKGNSSRHRRRDQRACVRCSQLKIKCDRLAPCSRCQRGAYQCIYKDRQRTRTEKSPERLNASHNTPSPKSSFQPLDSTQVASDPFAGLEMGSFPPPTSTVPPFGQDFSQTMDWTQDVGLPATWENDTWSQNAAWPWLHEALYLQTDPGWDDSNNFTHTNDSRTARYHHQSTFFEEDMPLEDHTARKNATRSLIKSVFELSESASTRSERAQFWRKESIKIESVFELQGALPLDGSSSHILEYFVSLYFENFHPLWPLFWNHGLIFDDIQPYLYITLGSIGSIYVSKAAANFHVHTLDVLRMQLLLATFQHQLPDEPLCQSLLLIQVATLYFGHRKAFSTAQQLGSIVVSLARKMNLFGENTAIIPELIARKAANAPCNDLIQTWIERETRKRLAFGIFRLEVFVSLLLGQRPLVSFEEVKCRMPCSDALWNNCENKDQLAQELLSLAEEQPAHVYCDLIHIALDQDEELPNLSPTHLELLLFGLQLQVWRFSHDPGLMTRLGLSSDMKNAADRAVNFAVSQKSSSPRASPKRDPSGIDLLDHSRRHMHDLKADRARTFSSLRKWKRAMVANANRGHIKHQRNTLLASHLLFNLSFIRLRADLPTFHRIFLDVVKSEPSHASLAAVHKWSKTSDGWDATEHACATWSLITTELERPQNSRASFNILSYVALLHAAAVVWVYAGTHTSPTTARLDMDHSAASDPKRTDLRLYRGNNRLLMLHFADLLRKIAPSWTTVSSFQTTVSIMAQNPIPLLSSREWQSMQKSL